VADPTVLLYGSADNPSLGLLHQGLTRRGRRHSLFILQENFPFSVGIYLKVGRGLHGALLLGQEELSLTDLCSVALDGFVISPAGLTEFSAQDAQYLQTESWACLISMFHQLSRHCLVANHVVRRDYLTSRWAELNLLCECGLAVPRTLVTSRPESAREFYESLAGRVICKPVAGTAPVFREVSPEDLDNLHRLTLCPVHYEEMPEGWACRLAVVGGLFFQLPEGTPPPPEVLEGVTLVCRFLSLQLAEFSLRQLGSQWIVTGLRTFLSPEALGQPHVLEAACALLEQEPVS
jgi:hypothetical protein